jgi:CopG family nickel-responsive transcriptional regulator
MSDLTRMSLSIEQPLFEKLEAMVASSNYDTRSEFIRDLIRRHLVEEEWQSDTELIATILLVYDHHARGLLAALTDLQHDFAGQVLATTHVHLDHHHCAEMIMVRGRGDDIRRLSDGMRKRKGVLHAELACGSTGKNLA